MRCVFFACSESSSLDMQSGRVSLFHLIDEMQVASFPVFIQTLSVSLTIERESDDPASAELHFVIRVNNLEIVRLPNEVEFNQRLRARVLNNIQGLIIPQPGTVFISVEYKGEMLSEWQILVSIIDPPQQVLAFAQHNLPTVAKPTKSKRKTVISKK